MQKASAVTAMYPVAAGTHGRTASPSSAHTAVMHQSAAVPRRRNNRFANAPASTPPSRPPALMADWVTARAVSEKA